MALAHHRPLVHAAGGRVGGWVGGREGWVVGGWGGGQGGGCEAGRPPRPAVHLPMRPHPPTRTQIRARENARACTAPPAASLQSPCPLSEAGRRRQCTLRLRHSSRRGSWASAPPPIPPPSLAQLPHRHTAHPLGRPCTPQRRRAPPPPPPSSPAFWRWPAHWPQPRAAPGARCCAVGPLLHGVGGGGRV